MPVLTDILKFLPKVAREAVEAAGPEVKGILGVMGKQGVEEVPYKVWGAAMKQGFKIAPEQAKLFDTAAPHVAAAFRSQRLNIPIPRAFGEVTMAEEEARGVLNMLQRESFEAGVKSKPVTVSAPNMPALTRNIELQSERQKIMDKLHEARKLRNDTEAARLLGDLEVVNRGFTGNEKLISDLTFSRQVLGPQTLASMKFDTAEGHLVTDMMAAKENVAGNTKSSLGWWFGLTSKRGPAGWFPNLSRNRAFQKDMQAAFKPVEINYMNYSKNFTELTNLQDKIKAIGNATYPEAVKLQKKVDKLLPQVAQDLAIINESRYPAFMKWAQMEGPAGRDARIAMWRGDASLKRWVTPIIKPEEVKVADAYGGMMKQWRLALDAQGIPTMSPKGEEEYTSHLLRQVMGLKRGKYADEYLKKRIGYISSFHHRNPGSLMFWPSIHGIATEYFPMAARKLGMTAWKRKWVPIIGDKPGQGLMSHWPKMQDYFRRYAKLHTENLSDEGLWERSMRQLTAWTYLSKVGFTLSTPIKHVGKAVRLLATHPIDAVRNIPAATRVAAEMATERFAKNPSDKLKLTRNFIASRSFLESFSGMTIDSGIMNQVNTLANAPVAFVEAFERGLTFLTALGRAQRKGLSHDQFVRAAYDMILSNSFVGGADRPLWLHHGWQQLLGIFAYTPFRISEETFKMAWKSLPKKYITDLKGEMLTTAWKMPKDAFGTTYLKHFLSFTTAVGLAEGYARMNDTSIWQILAFHVPGWRRAAGGAAELTSPPLQIYDDYRKRGGGAEAFGSSVWDFVTSFSSLDRYLAEKPYMAAGGSWARHLTAMPSVKAQKDIEKIMGQKRITSPALEKKRMERLRKRRVLGQFWPLTYTTEGEAQFAPPWKGR